MRQFNLVYEGKYKFVVKANGIEMASIKYMVKYTRNLIKSY